MSRLQKMKEKLVEGSTFYESGYGMVVEYVVTTAATFNGGKLEWIGRNTEDGAEINFLITEGYEHYGPNIHFE